jgi:hypothetical protein
MKRARLVTRRGPCFPFRNRLYWDCTAFGAGYVACSGGPGAAVLDDTKGLLLNLSTGAVYNDSRFNAPQNS